MYDSIQETVNYLQEHISQTPEIGIILGSGLGGLTDRIANKIVLPYDTIPNFPSNTIQGHAGNLVFGTIGGKYVVVMQGRSHYYEGKSMQDLAFPIYLMKFMGARTLIITNACGGINPEFKPGDLMIIDDFINGVSDNPLRGLNDDRLGPRFPDMSEPYRKDLQEKAMHRANTLNIRVKKGVYAYFQGPYYETRAEIKMYARVGCDAIGMSTVPETIVANHCGLDVLGIACITNMATGLQNEKHSHDDVLEMALKSSQDVCQWIESLLENDF